MKAIRAIFAATLIGAATIVPASAQDRISLQSGFVPDPHVTSVSAGGSYELSEEDGADCTGFVTEAPTLRLIYDAGDEEGLFIAVRSEADTVLKVRSPDGSVVCSDDAFDANYNPGVSFAHAQTGLYQIWVGNYDDPEAVEAELHISEIGFGVTETEESDD